MRRHACYLVALFLFTLLWTGYQYLAITITGDVSKPREADVIIVLGAAVWPQGPSPALQARIYHARELYDQGYAGNIILSGGLGLHPPTEAEAMARVLRDLGVDTAPCIWKRAPPTPWRT